jgi:hypothetical protein
MRLCLFLLGSVSAFVPHSTTRRPSLLRSDVVEKYEFAQIKSLDSRLANLEQNAPDVLGSFYEPHLKSFSVRPGSVTVSKGKQRECRITDTNIEITLTPTFATDRS